MRQSLKLSTCILCALVPVSALSHHSRANYDMQDEVVFEGTIIAMEWKNPHIGITLDINNDRAGQPVRQEIEALAISEANALGLTREAIAPGSKVVVRAHPGRSGPGRRALGLDVTTSDGKIYPLNTDAKYSIHVATVKAQGLAGQWAPTLASFNGTSETTATWQLTQAGIEAREAYRAKFNRPGIASLGICEQFPPPRLSIFPDMRVIEVSENKVVMRFEGAVGVLMQREVHLDQTTHPAGLTPSLMGHSIGRWEDGALVIDTVAFTASDIGSIGMPSTTDKHLVERLALTDDQLQLEYSFTLEDPTYLQQPATYSALWDHRPDLEPPTATTCDAENARRATNE
jgi:hypothetical protein